MESGKEKENERERDVASKVALGKYAPGATAQPFKLRMKKIKRCGNCVPGTCPTSSAGDLAGLSLLSIGKKQTFTIPIDRH